MQVPPCPRAPPTSPHRFSHRLSPERRPTATQVRAEKHLGGKCPHFGPVVSISISSMISRGLSQEQLYTWTRADVNLDNWMHGLQDPQFKAKEQYATSWFCTSDPSSLRCIDTC